MTLIYSIPFEDLHRDAAEFHTVVVGSGYGAAMAALALAMRRDKPYKNEDILVIERGNEYAPGDFPKTIADLPGYISTQGNAEARTGYADALFDIRVGENVTSIVASGLGGTSLINAGVVVDPDDTVLNGWPSGSGPTWSQRLGPSLAFARKVLDVQKHPGGMQLAKVSALQALGRSIHGAARATHSLADIAVNFKDGPNPIGVEQYKCNDCGNCFTGCNIGAKSTLAMNAWPLAKSLGIKIVTGGMVERISQATGSARAWRVLACRTTDAQPDRPSRIQIAAHRVILAAGTFGSTEILARSANPDTDGNFLTLSGRIGSQFSLNGDGIAFGYGQRAKVSSYAKVPSAIDINPLASEKPGPTIVSMLRVADSKGDPKKRGLIEDATVPQAIARFWGELLSTQAMTRAYVPGKPSAWNQKNPAVDPLANSSDLMDHHQAVLLMGVDDAAGRLEFSHKYDHLQISWPPRQVDSNRSGDRIDRWFADTLSAAADQNGFDGGLYLDNPLWRPLPEAFESVFEGASQLGGTHVCNHPLGGCPMGNDATQGVVDTSGRVFCSTTGNSRYPELYVLDGSILPGALGINPLLTIAALAHHLALQMDDPVQCDTEIPRASNLPIVARNAGQNIVWPVPPLSFVFHERLFGPSASDSDESLRGVLDALRPIAEKGACGPGSVVIDIDVEIPSIYEWLANPTQQLDAFFTVYRNDNWKNTIGSIGDDDLSDPLIRRAKGHVSILARDAQEPPIVWRSLLAVWRFCALRGDEISALGGSGQANQNLFTRILGFLRVAAQHARWRYFRYSCDLTIKGRPLRISGEKCLAYDGSRSRKIRDESNLWTTLANIELTFLDTHSQKGASAWFRVDLVRMARHLDFFECTTLAETPQIVSAVASAAALAVRAFLQTHLWSFGAPSYKDFPTAAEIDQKFHLYEAPAAIRYSGSDRVQDFPVAVVVPDTGTHWRLMKASPTSVSRSPVLLIHGISHSSRVFYTETLDVNLAGYLLNLGHEVWILDHGLSTALKPDYSYRPAIDDIAAHVTKAVRYVYESARKNPDTGVLVFSHCIGAATLSMSILKGDLIDANTHKPLIKALVMHAVPPWIYASATNLIRAYAGVAFRSRFFPDVINPIPTANTRGTSPPSGFENLIDRLGMSFPWTCGEYHAHNQSGRYGKFARAICNRMTAYYGYEWVHANLNDATHEAFCSLMGPANVDAYRQLYFFVNRQRVTDRNGTNQFVQAHNFRDYWTFPTMFLHGRENEAFDVESSRLSAHQLKFIRDFYAPVPPGPPPDPVDLTIVDRTQYGHLDVLLGKNAYRDSFESIAKFFNQPIQNPTLEPPRSSTTASNQLTTGPIISRPTFVNGMFTLRIWAETNEFKTSPTDNVEYHCANAPGGLLPLIRWIRSGLGTDAQRSEQFPNTLKNSMFWIGDFEVNPRMKKIEPKQRSGVGNLKSFEMGFHPVAIDKMKSAMSVDSTDTTASTTALAGSPVLADAPDDSIDWTALPWFKRFMANRDESSVSFALGSCWYPGSWFDETHADRIFEKVQELIIDPAGIDHLLLVGDQIYADASYGLLDIAENRERFQESYRHAFRSPWGSWVLSNIPTYLVIDDHEFRDNYPTARPGDNPVALRDLGASAIQEAWNFQMHKEGLPPDPVNIYDNRLWYDFKSRGFAFFVFDTRSERNPKSVGLRSILSSTQEEGFRAWAANLNDPTRPVFLVTGSPLAPIPTDEINFGARASTSDSLRGFPDFVALIAEVMMSARCTQHIVLLSGDPHFSSICEFTIARAGTGSPLIEGVSIISSGVSVPLPFANDRAVDIAWNPPERVFHPQGAKIQLSLKHSELMSNRPAHVLRLDLVRSVGAAWKLTVNAIETDGRVARQPITVLIGA